MTSRLLALRRGSVVLLVLWIGVLVGTFLDHRFRQRSQVETAEVEATPKDGQEQPVRVHKGFVYSDTLGIEPNFRIAAREAVEFASGWYEFHDVQVSLYHDGRVAYGLVSERLRFDPANHEAETGGEAEVSLRGGVALRAPGFTLGGRDRLLKSRGPTTFAGPGWGGLAGSAVCSLEKNTVELSGGTTISWRGSGVSGEPSLILLAPRLTYDRRQAVARFPDGLTVLRGRLRLRSGHAELQLASPEGELRRATFAAPVRVDGTLDDGSDVDAEAGDTTIESLAGARYRLSAEPASDAGWVTVRWADRTVGWREVTAWRIVGEGSRSAWEWLDGQGLACATEIGRDSEPRRAHADSIRLVFQDGQPTTVLAREAVRVETGDQWAEGGELELSLGTRRFSLRPETDKRVAIGAPGTLAKCDRLEGSEGGSTVARGDVVGTLERGGAAATGPPIRFAAATATAARGGDTLTLEGDARLWQDDRLVRADRLDYDRAGDVVNGEGAVLTTARTASKEGPPGRVEVRARKLRYDRPAGVATYQGDVALDDRRAQASCQSLVATLDSGGALISANLDGGVTVRDRATSRVLTGQRARLMVEEGTFEIWGSPVLVQDPGGDQVKASHLQWNRASNTVVVLGAEDNPSETLYHPSQPRPTPPGKGRNP